VDKKKSLEELAKRISSCTRCPLYKKANRAVPGEGSPEARVMFIGEGPGYYEDQKGIPFCGAAGNLLDKQLLRIKLQRKDVFIGNMVKHRPPGNRDPLPAEIEACRPWLDEQVKVIDPEIVVTLGRFSMNKFLPGEYISKIHGQPRFITFAGKKRIVVPMFHPAAALRRGEIMQQTTQDFEKLAKILKGGKMAEETSLKEKEEEKPDKEIVQLGVFDLNEKG